MIVNPPAICDLDMELDKHHPNVVWMIHAILGGRGSPVEASRLNKKQMLLILELIAANTARESEDGRKKKK